MTSSQCRGQLHEMRVSVAVACGSTNPQWQAATRWLWRLNTTDGRSDERRMSWRTA